MLEEGEVFDSSLLKETVNNLIISGKRNFALDMSPLDYVYSDTINILMLLNKRVLDVTGRLSLMAPQPEVIQVLKRAGINNILKIFDTEAELIRSSEAMILQTASIKLSDVQDINEPAPPESEFDQLRTEIGSVFGSDDHAPEMMQQPEVDTMHVSPSGEDEFSQMFQNFESKPQSPASRALPPQDQQRKTPPLPPQFNAPQPPQFQPRQFVPPRPTPPQSTPSSFEMPPRPIQRSQQVGIPKSPQDFSAVRPETQMFPTVPVINDQQTRRKDPVVEEAFDLESESIPPVITSNKAFKASSLDNQDFQHDDEFFNKKRGKKSIVPVLIIAFLVVALAGSAALIAYLSKSKNTTKNDSALTKEMPQKTAPQVPVQPVVSDTTPLQASTESAEELTAKPAKPQQKTTPPSQSTRNVTRTRKPRTITAEAVKPSVTNKVDIVSIPSGATIAINGQDVGQTPYTWSKPFFGNVTITLSKDGYQEIVKSFEFTGGSMRESFTLKRAVAPEPPSRPVAKAIAPIAPTPPPAPKPVEKEELPPAVAPPPPPAPVDFGDEEDAGFDMEPAASVASPATAPASTGAVGLIFIASIPPVADVYIGEQLIGKTNVSELKIPVGTHTLRFVKGGKEITKQLTLQAGKNPSQMVRIP